MRYFIEVSYKGTRYAGFQVQQNANTIQAEVEKALSIICRFPVSLTGSSRTDAGVHANQNYFHVDVDQEIKASSVYNLNALLPADIVVKSVVPVHGNAHCRFLASSRRYKYYITTEKNSFKTETAWYYPFTVNLQLLNLVAGVLYKHDDFTSFSKRNTQTYTNRCSIIKSEWVVSDASLIYTVEANRFLRGMVRGLVATMLLVGRRKITPYDFEEIIKARDCSKANFASPPHGLFLEQVNYPSNF